MQYLNSIYSIVRYISLFREQVPLPFHLKYERIQIGGKWYSQFSSMDLDHYNSVIEEKGFSLHSIKCFDLNLAMSATYTQWHFSLAKVEPHEESGKFMALQHIQICALSHTL